MRLIPAALHRMLDFVTVAAFALAPSILDLTRVAATLAYVLAVIHLAMTLLTRFSPADRGLVSLGLHGAVESIVGVALVALPWLMKWQGTSRISCMAAGGVILVVWVFSRYRVATSPAAA